MTLLSPLSDIHKIRIYGNIENKAESNLLEISEETSKSIYQITKFKNSNSFLTNLSIRDLEISNNPMIVKSNLKTRILWTGPNQWLIISDDKILEDEIARVRNWFLTRSAVPTIRKIRNELQHIGRA